MKQVKPGYWQGEVWHGGARKKITFHGSARDAKDYEATKRLEIQKKGIIRDRDILTFKEFTDDKYVPMAESELRGTTWGVRRCYIKTLKAFLGDLRLTKITEEHVEHYKRERRKTVGKVSINSELATLSAIRTYAKFLKVPCADFVIRYYRVRRKKGKVQFFSREEVGYILAACAIHLPSFLPIVTFLFETGCRKSEAINLRWEKVMLAQRIVRIWSETGLDDEDEDDEEDEEGGDYEVKSMEREVPLSDQLQGVLEALKLAGLSREYVFPVRADTNGTKGQRVRFFPKYTWVGLIKQANTLARAPLVQQALEGGASREEAERARCGSGA